MSMEEAGKKQSSQQKKGKSKEKTSAGQASDPQWNQFKTALMKSMGSQMTIRTENSDKDKKDESVHNLAKESSVTSEHLSGTPRS